MKRTLIVTILLLMVSISLSAQERLTPEEMFRWFPEGKYDEIRHYNLEIADKQKGFKTYLADEGITAKDWYNDIEMPVELTEKFSSVTAMTTVRIVAYTGKQRPFGRGGKVAGSSFGDIQYLSNSFGIKMTVVRVAANINLKKRLPALKSVTKTEETLKELPLYLLDTKYLKKHAVTLYLWLSPDGELLICEELKLLKKMVAAGYGEIPDVLTEFPFPRLLESLSYLGPGWEFMSWKPSFRATWLQAEKDGVDLELINADKEKRLNTGDGVGDLIFDSPVQRRYIEIYEDDEIAQAALIKRTVWNKNARYNEPFQKVKDKYTSLKREDNKMVTTILLTPEYRKADDEFYVYLDKRHKAREKAEKAEENGEDLESEEK